MRALLTVRLGVDEQHVGNRPVGDVDLGPVQRIMVALAPSGRTHRAKGVRAGPGLGEA